MGSKMETDMRGDLFHHLQKLSFGYYSEAKVGQIMARITSDLFQVTEFAHHCPEEFLIAGVKIVVSFVVLCTKNVGLTLLMFAVLPFMLVFAKHFNAKMRRIFKERNKQVGEINAQVEDSLLGIRVVKSFANEEIEEEKFRKGNLRFLDLKADSYKTMAQFGTSNRIFDGLMYIVIVMAGALLIGKGELSLGDFTAYLLYATVLLNSIRRIVEFTEQFQQGMTGIDRFFEVLDAPIDITDAEDAKEMKNVKGAVAFENVSFHYGDDDAEVLHGLNLTVEPGQSIALVGPSGAGKTTLCNLLPRFYDVTGGRILIDGEDIRSQKAVVAPEGQPRVREGAAGTRRARHHVAVVPGDDGHRGGAEHEADHRAYGARRGKEGGAGHHEGAPADGAPERHGPGGQGGEGAEIRFRGLAIHGAGIRNGGRAASALGVGEDFGRGGRRRPDLLDDDARGLVGELRGLLRVRAGREGGREDGGDGVARARNVEDGAGGRRDLAERDPVRREQHAVRPEGDDEQSRRVALVEDAADLRRREGVGGADALDLRELERLAAVRCDEAHVVELEGGAGLRVEGDELVRAGLAADGADDVARHDALRVVRDDDRVGRRDAGGEGLRDVVGGERVGGGRVLAVDAAELLVAAHDARLLDRAAGRVGQDVVEQDAAPAEDRAELLRPGVGPHRADEVHRHAEGAEVARHVGGPAGRVGVAVGLDDGHGRLGRNACRIAPEIVVQHQVPDDENAETGYFPKQFLHGFHCTKGKGNML